VSEAPWSAIAPEGDPLPARSFGEALLYLRVRGAAVLAARRREDRGRVLLEVRALHDGAEKRFAFRLPVLDEADDLHLGGGPPSKLLDPADLVLFAARIEREAPPDLTALSPAELRRWERDFQLAAEAALEATKFVAPGTGGVPESAFTTTAARWLYRKDPSRFSRAGLTALEQHMSNRARAFQRALPDAPQPGDEE